MNTTPVGVGVVGTGVMGRTFAQICKQLPEARLVGVTDIVESVGQAAAKEFDVRYFKDHEELTSDPNVQALIIATSEDAHVAPSLAALEQGKGVLVEKPIADNVADGQKMVQAAEQSGAVLMVGHILRFTTHYAMAKQMVDEGKLGSIQSMQIRILNGRSAQNRLQGRCSLPMFLGVHQYDLVRWVAGSEPVRVYAESQFNVLRPLGYDVEDTTWALITFANGALGVCEAGWILPEGHPSRSDHRLWVQGSQGRIDVELMPQGMMLSTDEATAFPGTFFTPRVHGDIRGPFVHEVQHFVRCVRDDKEPMITGQDGLIAVRMAEAVEESARTHQPVAL
jgi:UDP-N-acetylglucosamine 3-dehydrogenase